MDSPILEFSDSLFDDFTNTQEEVITDMEAQIGKLQKQVEDLNLTFDVTQSDDTADAAFNAEIDAAFDISTDDSWLFSTATDDFVVDDIFGV